MKKCSDLLATIAKFDPGSEEDGDEDYKLIRKYPSFIANLFPETKDLQVYFPTYRLYYSKETRRWVPAVDDFDDLDTLTMSREDEVRRALHMIFATGKFYKGDEFKGRHMILVLMHRYPFQVFDPQLTRQEMPLDMIPTDELPAKGQGILQGFDDEREWHSNYYVLNPASDAKQYSIAWTSLYAFYAVHCQNKSFSEALEKYYQPPAGPDQFIRSWMSYVVQRAEHDHVLDVQHWGTPMAHSRNLKVSKKAEEKLEKLIDGNRYAEAWALISKIDPAYVRNKLKSAERTKEKNREGGKGHTRKKCADLFAKIADFDSGKENGEKNYKLLSKNPSFIANLLPESQDVQVHFQTARLSYYPEIHAWEVGEQMYVAGMINLREQKKGSKTKHIVFVTGKFYDGEELTGRHTIVVVIGRNYTYKSDVKVFDPDALALLPTSTPPAEGLGLLNWVDNLRNWKLSDYVLSPAFVKGQYSMAWCSLYAFFAVNCAAADDHDKKSFLKALEEHWTESDAPDRFIRGWMSYIIEKARKDHVLDVQYWETAHSADLKVSKKSEEKLEKLIEGSHYAEAWALISELDPAYVRQSEKRREAGKAAGKNCSSLLAEIASCKTGKHDDGKANYKQISRNLSFIANLFPETKDLDVHFRTYRLMQNGDGWVGTGLESHAFFSGLLDEAKENIIFATAKLYEGAEFVGRYTIVVIIHEGAVIVFDPEAEPSLDDQLPEKAIGILRRVSFTRDWRYRPSDLVPGHTSTRKYSFAWASLYAFLMVHCPEQLRSIGLSRALERGKHDPDTFIRSWMCYVLQKAKDDHVSDVQRWPSERTIKVSKKSEKEIDDLVKRNRYAEAWALITELDPTYAQGHEHRLRAAGASGKAGQKKNKKWWQPIHQSTASTSIPA